MIIEIKERRTISTRNSKGRMNFLTQGLNEISRQDFDRMMAAQGVAKKMYDLGTLVIIQDELDSVSRETSVDAQEPAPAVAQTASERVDAQAQSKPAPSKPAVDSNKSIADMDVKSAVLLIRSVNDIGELEKLFEIEKRETILKAISQKIDELKSK